MRRSSASPHATVAWVVLVAALLLFLFFADVPQPTLFWDAFFDAGHAPLFGVIAIALLRIVSATRPGIPPARAWGIAFWTAFGIGAATEVLQFFQPSRDPSFIDLSRDFAGSAGFLLLAAAVPRASGRTGPLRSVRQRWAAAALGLALLGVAWAYLASTVVLYAERDARLPVVVSFDGSWWERRLIEEHDSRLVYGQRPPGGADEAGEFVRLDLKRAEYPGFQVTEPYPDWRGYHALTFTVISALDHPVALNVRIHDERHDNRFADRFNRGLVIAPGVNRVVIPIDDIRRAPDRREMDLAHVKAIILFAHRPPAALQVYVGPFRLE
jgi:hypothetical protein